MPDGERPDQLNRMGRSRLPGLFGLEITSVEHGLARGRLAIRSEHLALNGYLHAATVIALADTCCGYGCIASLPEGRTGFTTIEVKSNFVGTTRKGAIVTEAHILHGGRSTQVWDATVRDEASGKVIALFRCTQMLL